MEPHQERVVAELNARTHELNKLQAFFETDTFAVLEEEEKNLMLSQAEAMTDLTNILRKRIDLWRKTSGPGLAALEFFDSQITDGTGLLSNLTPVEMDKLRNILVDMANNRRVQAVFALELIKFRLNELRGGLLRLLNNRVPHGVGNMIGWPGTATIADEAVACVCDRLRIEA